MNLQETMSQPRRSRTGFLALTAVVLGVLITGCDPQVQGIVLGGLNDLAVTLVDAFFTAITPVEQAAAAATGT